MNMNRMKEHPATDFFQARAASGESVADMERKTIFREQYKLQNVVITRHGLEITAIDTAGKMETVCYSGRCCFDPATNVAYWVESGLLTLAFSEHGAEAANLVGVAFEASGLVAPKGRIYVYGVVRKLLDERHGEGADFSSLELRRLDLSGVMAANALFIRADLTSANLQHADLRGANFYGADLTGADLRGAIFCDRMGFTPADLRGSGLEEK